MIVLVGDEKQEAVRENFFPAVARELEERGIPHRAVWLTTGGSEPRDLWALRRVTPADGQLVWLVANAATQALAFLAYSRGRIYCYAHHETLHDVKGEGERPPEKHPLAMLGPGDGIFVDCKSTGDQLREWFPNLRGRIFVAGFPVDGTDLKERAGGEKQPGLVLFAEPFTAETGHILKVELARRLLAEGFQVEQLIGEEQGAFVDSADVETRSLYDYASSVGMRFTFSKSIGDYYRLLARAVYLIAMARRRGRGFVGLTTIVEASLLGTAVLVPDFSVLSAYLSADNMYPAFNLVDLEARLRRPAGELVSAQREHLESLMVAYTGETVVDRLLAVMSGDGVRLEGAQP